MGLPSCPLNDTPKTTEFQLEVKYAEGKFALGQKKPAPAVRSYTVPIVEKFVEHAKADSEPTRG